jgi:hypothetical protein
VLQKVDNNDPMVANLQTVLKETFAEHSPNMYNHLLLSGKDLDARCLPFSSAAHVLCPSSIEYTDQIDMLPPELIDAMRSGGGATLYQDFREADPVVHAWSNNPMMLFLQSLLPGPLPNAPALEGNQQSEYVAAMRQLAEQIGLFAPGAADDEQERQGEDDT